MGNYRYKKHYNRKPYKKKNRISSQILNDNKLFRTAEDYALPETLGNPPKETKIALDSCFAPVANLLSHTLNALGAEGLPIFVGYGVLTGLVQNGLIRAGVEMRADEMTRKWGEFVAGGEDLNEEEADKKDDRVKLLQKEAKRFKIKEILNKAASYCGYYGGCLGFIDVGDSVEELANPLTLSEFTFRQNSLKGIKLIEPYNVSPGIYDSINPMSPSYYKPSVWYVQGTPVHSSRLIYFAENELPAILKPAYNFFGLSLSQKVLDAVSHFTQNRESAGRLLQKYSLTIFKTDMEDILSGGMDGDLQNRVKYFVQNRDNDGCATIDKDSEDIVMMTTSLSGVTDLVRQSMEYVAAMFNEPVTKMWGLSPNGFNTGDADLQNHYDNIESLQQKIFGEPMELINRILQINKFGKIDRNISFKFAPLSEDDKSQQIANNKIKAETGAILMENGTITPEDERQRIIDDPDSGYNNLSPYEEPTETGDPLVPYNPELDPDKPEETKEVTVL